MFQSGEKERKWIGHFSSSFHFHVKWLQQMETVKVVINC